ncbi:terpene synthase family protein [Aspergillus saccharolyticus JOP 1030-1]|uniref:Terpenoid synthase n=1 Tax=Aspergillus saccharolyticus JOP 1030-1 TaxID=1450539 RepID=A0A318Z8R5_9EURO|nr:terpenoid synthase [Aspergillus saccharolyticus JOP 1030-1]PYH43735.1 terpenoid synthase [Aspergillus saccharolyticus JOP 1030-1]
MIPDLIARFWIVQIHIRVPEWLKSIKGAPSRRPQDGTTISKNALVAAPKPAPYKPKHYRHIIYAYDVQEEKSEIPVLEHDPFDFLDPQKTLVPPENTILIDPVAVGLPWFSTMKGTPQCIHWREAEAAGLELIEKVMAARGAGAVIPEKLKTSDQRRKMMELVETAVTICIYLYAVSDVARIRVLTKSIVFLFLHDDVMESRANVEGNSILEGWDTDSFQANELEGESRNDIFLDFCREAIALDPILGLELMQDTVRWARYSRDNSTKPNKSHATWQDFRDFRELDIAYDFMVTAVRFGAATLYDPAERPVFEWIEKLYIRHCLYINDLYSYEKELREYQQEGAPLHNSVHMIEQVLSVPPSSAKAILRSVLWDCERQVREEYVRLMALPEMSETQKFYLKRLIESFAGNYLYSMSTYRYARLSGKLIGPPPDDCMLKSFVQ